MGLAYRESLPAASSERAQAFFELAPHPLAVVAAGPHPIFVSVNDAFLRLMVGERHAVEGQPIHTVFRAVAAAQVRDAVESCLRDEAEVRLRIAHAPRGKVVRLEVTMRSMKLDGERFVMLGLAPLEQSLSLSELGEAGVLAELGALSRGLVYIHDVRRGRSRYGRHPLVARLGLPPAATDVAELAPRIHPEDLTDFERHLAGQAMALDERVATITFRMRDADEQWVWINLRSRAFTRDREGRVHRVIGVATDVTEFHAYAADLAAAAEALDRAEVNERRRIGRELHDSTSQLLVAARLSLGLFERLSEVAPPARRAIDEARQLIAMAQAEIRNFSYMLHPPALRTDGLPHSLRDYAKGFARRTGLVITVRIGRSVGRLPERHEHALYRIAQEAIMNAYRHARASRVSVRLRALRAHVVLEVEDDGIGLSGAGAWSSGVGISGMRARMTQLGGSLSLNRGRKGLLVRAKAEVTPPAA